MQARPWPLVYCQVTCSCSLRWKERTEYEKWICIWHVTGSTSQLLEASLFILYNTYDSRKIKLTEEIFVRAGEKQPLSIEWKAVQIKMLHWKILIKTTLNSRKHLTITVLNCPVIIYIESCSKRGWNYNGGTWQNPESCSSFSLQAGMHLECIFPHCSL